MSNDETTERPEAAILMEFREQGRHLMAGDYEVTGMLINLVQMGLTSPASVAWLAEEPATRVPLAYAEAIEGAAQALLDEAAKQRGEAVQRGEDTAHGEAVAAHDKAVAAHDKAVAAHDKAVAAHHQASSPSA